MSEELLDGKTELIIEITKKFLIEEGWNSHDFILNFRGMIEEQLYFWILRTEDKKLINDYEIWYTKQFENGDEINEA